MKILGIDYGDARTGLSLSDVTGMLAGSPSVISEWNREKLLDKLCDYINQNKVEEIVLGYPKNMDGSVGERAEKCKALANDLADRTGLNVVLWDERQTTVAAHHAGFVRSWNPDAVLPIVRADAGIPARVNSVNRNHNVLLLIG